MLALVVGLVPVAALLFFGYGIVDPEGAVFLRQYWEDRPIGEMIFNPERNDWGFYSGRELSHVFDWLDSLFVLLAARHSQVILGLHASAWLANLLVMALVVWRGPVVFPGTNRVFWLLLAGIYLSSLPIALSPLVFHRASRLLSATAGLAALWMLIDCRISADRRPLPPGRAGGQLHHAAMALVAAFAVLMDRIGLAVILAAFGVVVLHAIWRKRGWLSAAWLLASIAVCQIYHSFVGPALNARFSDFQGEVAAQPFTTSGLAPWELLAASARYLANVVPMVLGGLPWWAALMAAALFAAAAWRRAAGPGKAARFAAFTVAALAAIATAYAITVATIYVLPSIRAIGSANCYYYPVYAASLLWLVLAVGSASMANGTGGLVKRSLPWCLALVLASNLVHWPIWETRFQQCSWFSGMVADTARLRRSCEEKKMNPEMSGRHRRLLSVVAEECPWLAASYWPAAEPLTGFFVARKDADRPPRFWVGPGAKIRLHAPAKGKYELKLAVAGVVEGDCRLIIKSKGAIAGEIDLPARPGEAREFQLPLDLRKGATTLELDPSVDGPMLSTLGLAETPDGTDAPIGCALVGIPVLRPIDN
jgi:hypothetical protein